MAAGSGVIGIRLKIDGARAAKDDLDKVGRSMRALGDDKLFNGIAKGVAGVGAAVGAAALGASVAVGAFVKTSLDSLARIERINAQTDSVIKSTNGAAKVTAQHVEDMTGALENQTGTEAESIQQGANMLLTFTNIKNAAGANNDIFDQATKTITDMSRAFDTTGGAVIDTTGTAIQLGKALNDPIKGVTALRKVGVSFTEDQQKQIKTMVESGDQMGAQKVILAELQKEFGGAGEAFAKTSKGQIELAGHAWGTFGEALSTALLPAIGTVAGGLAELFNYAATEVPNLEGTFSGLADKMVGASHRIVTGVKSVIDNAGGIKASLSLAFNGEELKTSQAGVTALADSVQGAFGLSDDTTAKLTQFMDLFVAGAQGVLAALTPVWQGIQNAPVSGLKVIQFLLERMAENREAVSVLASALTTVAVAVTAVRVATAIWTGVQAALNVVLDANPIGIIIIAIAALVGGIIYAYQHSQTFRDVLASVWDWMKKAAVVAYDLWSKFTPLGIAVSLVKDHFDDIKGAVGGFIDKIKEAFDWINRIGDKITNSAFGKAMSGAGGAISGFLGIGGKNPASANGGPVEGGKIGLVGERGPEAFVPAVNGRILSHEDSVAALSGSLAHLAPSGGTDVVVHQTTTLDGRVLFESWQKHAAKKMART